MGYFPKEIPGLIYGKNNQGTFLLIGSGWMVLEQILVERKRSILTSSFKHSMYLGKNLSHLIIRLEIVLGISSTEFQYTTTCKPSQV